MRTAMVRALMRSAATLEARPMKRASGQDPPRGSTSMGTVSPMAMVRPAAVRAAMKLGPSVDRCHAPNAARATCSGGMPVRSPCARSLGDVATARGARAPPC